MKSILSLISLLVVLIMGALFSMLTGLPLWLTVGIVFVASLMIPKREGALFDTVVPSTDVQTIAKWAGKYSKEFLNQMLNALDVFTDLKVVRNVSRHGLLMPKLTISSGARPLDTNVEENNKQERSWSGKKLYVKDCMKLFKLIPADLKESFLSDMLDPALKVVPFASWVWEKEMEKLASEINDNFYLQEYHADAPAWNAGSVYTGGTSYMKYTDDNYYKCVTTTTAGQSPDTHPAKWLEVNGLVSYDGPAKAIATAITNGVVPITTGAITSANAVTKIKVMYDAIPVSVRKKGGTFLMSQTTFDAYLEHEKTLYPNVLDQDMGDKPKYVYGSDRKWKIKPCTWMGTSGRVIANVMDKNLVVGTNLTETPGVTNTIQTLHGYKAIAVWLFGFEIADDEVLYINDQA